MDLDEWRCDRPGSAPRQHLQSLSFQTQFRGKAGATATVHVSADSEYVLYCNGARVGCGPAKGDVLHQFYDTYVFDDLLAEGANVLGALVVSYDPSYDSRPTSRMSVANAVVLDGAVEDATGTYVTDLTTGDGWVANPASDLGTNPDRRDRWDLNEHHPPIRRRAP